VTLFRLVMSGVQVALLGAFLWYVIVGVHIAPGIVRLLNP